jgi:hypothetical protein
MSAPSPPPDEDGWLSAETPASAGVAESPHPEAPQGQGAFRGTHDGRA